MITLWIALIVAVLCIIPVTYVIVTRVRHSSDQIVKVKRYRFNGRYLLFTAFRRDSHSYVVASIEENEIVSITFPEIGKGENMSRGLPLVKWVLAIPLYIVGLIYIIYAFLLTLLGWFSILFTGTYPERCAEGVVGTIAYWNRVVGYALVLVTDEYPTFSL